MLNEAEKKESKQEKPGNPYHSKNDGKFTSYEDEDYCWSLFFSEPNRGRVRGNKGSKVQKAISKPQDAGRGATRDGHGSYKCSTNTKVQ